MSLEWIKAEIERLAAIIGAPADMLPTYGRTEDFARPHIEFDGAGYHFVVVERGKELQRVRGDSDTVLYLVFKGVAFEMASAASAGKDRFRERLFAHKLALLGQLTRTGATASPQKSTTFSNARRWSMAPRGDHHG